MSTPRFATPRRWFSRLWWLLDASRRLVLNLIFLLLLVVIAVAFFTRGPKPLQDNTTLVLNLRGALVEQHAMGLRDAAMAQLDNQSARSTQLRDVLSVLDAAAADPQIARTVLLLDEFDGGGMASLREVGAALKRFRDSGKQVVAWGSNFDQRQYFLAAQASEVLLHPMGHVFMQGFGGHRNYYRDALDKLGVQVSVLRAGDYKNFGEPFVANGPSPESVESEERLYGGLWSLYTGTVEQARKLPAGSLMALINDLPASLAAANGDPAQLALDAKLVDGLKTRDELRGLLTERGAATPDGKTFRQVSFHEYLGRLTPTSSGDAVGVVVAEGSIVDGAAPAGAVGGASTAELIRRARDDAAIKAIVLRVNSPGGSAFGAELIRRELELTRAAGKPVVVSMGDVAASGGYWMSMAADQLLADAGTVTGSIGVFALLPSADQALQKLGVHTAGTTTTWLGGAADPRLPPNPRVNELLQLTIDRVYRDFTEKAALARKSTPADIEPLAQGRVWTGQQAQERGLVDTLGGLSDAIQSARTRANLGEDSRVIYIQPTPRRAEQLLALLGGAAVQAFSEQVDALISPAGVAGGVIQDVRHDLRWLTEATAHGQPFTAITHCLCKQP